MASIRTIRIGKAEMKWNTGKLRELVYDPENIRKMYHELIYPNIKDMDKFDKTIIKNFVERVMLDGTISNAQQFVDLMLALKLTCFDETKDKLEMYFVTPDKDSGIEKIMFWNIPFYLNHSVRHTENYCQVQWYRGWDGKLFGAAWNDAECCDKEHGTFEYILENQKTEYKENKKKYYK